MLQKAWWTICTKYLNFFSFFLQISCQSQFPDYDTGEDSGLADNFQPSVKVSCVGGTMKIRVDTKTPFKGIIHGPNRTEPGCSVLGKDGLKTYFNIDLTRISGSWVSFKLFFLQKIINFCSCENVKIWPITVNCKQCFIEFTTKVN